MDEKEKKEFADKMYEFEKKYGKDEFHKLEKHIKWVSEQPQITLRDMSTEMLTELGVIVDHIFSRRLSAALESYSLIHFNKSMWDLTYDEVKYFMAEFYVSNKN